MQVHSVNVRQVSTKIDLILNLVIVIGHAARGELNISIANLNHKVK